MRRAMRESDKAERRQLLRDVAWRLFQERAYEQINVQDVAREAELAKGTVYLYFATKEELFLSVQEQQFAAWFDALDAGLRALPPGGSADEVAAIIATSVAAAPSLIRLLTITHTILERNAGPEAIGRLKGLMRARLIATGALLEAALPALRPGQGARALLHGYALMAGLHGLAEPAPSARQAIHDNPDLALFSVDFAAELREALAALLRGQR